MTEKVSKRKVKIIIDGKALVDDHFSGVGHYAKGICEGLDEIMETDHNLDVRIAVPFKRADRLPKFGFKNIKVAPIPLPMRVFRRLTTKGVLPPMDLVVGRGVYFFPDYVRWPLANSRSITTIHDLSFEEVPQFVDDNNARFLRKTTRNSVAKSDKVATVTNTMKGIIEKFYKLDPSRVMVTHNAANLAVFYKHNEKDIERVKLKYKIFGKYIFTVGNIEPRKNQVSIVEAFMKLPKEIADEYTLVLAGAGAWKDEKIHEVVNKAIKKGYRVTMLLGVVTDEEMPILYSGASMMIYASFYEGYGMPIVEAMACRTPVICSNASVMPEVAGDAALMIDPHKVSDIKNAIIKLHDNPELAKEMVEKGIENVKRYDWKKEAQKLVDVAREF